ncbi:hypothetical protein ACFSUK_31595 [Sphingobium scionense]
MTMRSIGIMLAAGAMLAAAPAQAQETAGAAPQRARNIILFLGDAGGVPTLNAAGIMAHDRSRCSSSRCPMSACPTRRRSTIG